MNFFLHLTALCFGVALCAQDLPFSGRIHGDLNKFRQEWNKLMAAVSTPPVGNVYVNSISNALILLPQFSGVDVPFKNEKDWVKNLNYYADETIKGYKAKLANLKPLSDLFQSGARPGVGNCLLIIRDLYALSQNLAKYSTSSTDPWATLSNALKPTNLDHLAATARKLSDGNSKVNWKSCWRT